MKFDMYTEAIPSWALCYIFNGDKTGLTEEQIKAIDEFCAGYYDFEAPNPEGGDDEYFCRYPAIGHEPCAVYDINCFKERA